MLDSARFRRANPDRDILKPCVYVGMTGLRPEERFAKHKAGMRANAFVQRYGVRLLPKLYAYVIPTAVRRDEGQPEEPSLPPSDASTADGKATATRIETFELDDSFKTVVHECTGTGTWEYDPGTGPWSQEVAVFVDYCRLGTWEMFGTLEHPKLFVYIGDPDSWDLYVLERCDRAVPSGSRRGEPVS